MSFSQWIEVKVEMTQMTCPICGVCYSIPEELRRKREETGEPMFCCNGHQLSYKENEVARLRKMVEEANRRNTALAAELGSERAAKARLEKRVRRGVCPCCSRTFQNLARHMATKHPGKASQ